MRGQVCHLEKILKELSTEKTPIKMVFVDWASAFQHKGSKSPIREACDHPVLQSPFWNKKDSLQSVWTEAVKALDPSRGKIIRELKSRRSWESVLFALNKDNQVVGVYQFQVSGSGRKGRKGKHGLANPTTYSAVKSIIAKTIEPAAAKKPSKATTKPQDDPHPKDK